jgi:hypothetical protein
MMVVQEMDQILSVAVAVAPEDLEVIGVHLHTEAVTVE